nr:hypothetical protein [Tanacetum cinerariifolium]
MSSRNICHRGTNYLTEKYVRPTVSLEIVVGEGMPIKHSPANIPQRQVAGKSPEMSLGNVVNVVVPPLELPSWSFQKITNTSTHDEHGFIRHKA